MAKKTEVNPPAPKSWFNRVGGWFCRHKSVLALLAVGFLGGVLWCGAMRYFLVHEHEVHYHANFAVYINGQREEFKEFFYFEEIAACSDAYADNPKGRVHMHEQ